MDIPLNTSTSSAWQLWTNEKELEQWLTTRAHVEPKPNGPYELFWDPSNPNENSTAGCRITAFIPSKLLAFEWKGPVPYADLMNTAPLPTWVHISFEAITPSKTILHFRHSGWGQSTRWNEARSWQLDAWMGAFVNLRK